MEVDHLPRRSHRNQDILLEMNRHSYPPQPAWIAVDGDKFGVATMLITSASPMGVASPDVAAPCQELHSRQDGRIVRLNFVDGDFSRV